MALTRDEVLHLAHLSRLSLTDEEVTLFAEQLSPVVDYFTSLNEVNTADTKETSQTTGLMDVLRPDKTNPLHTLTQEAALSQANEEYNGQFVVPLILEKDSHS